MALLPSFKRLVTKDFDPATQPTIEKLGAILNDGIQSLYDALNKKLTFDDNFLGSIRDVELTVDSSGKPTTTVFVATGLTSAPRGILVIQATNLTNTAGYPTSAPFISYSVTNSGIQINNVTGLTAGNRYRLRIVTLG